MLRSTVVKVPLNFANAIPELTYRRAAASRVVVHRILDGVPTFVGLRFKAQLIVRIAERSKRYIAVRLVVILRRALLLGSDGLGTVSSLDGRNRRSSFISFLRLCRFQLVSRLWFGSLHDNRDVTNELIDRLVNEYEVFLRFRGIRPV